jgi:hypothetical protein
MKKACTQCGVKKEPAEFANSSRTKSGKKSRCKACKKIYNKEYHARPEVVARAKKYYINPVNNDRIKKRAKKYSQLPSTREAHRVYDKKNKALHPEKRRARDAVNNALRSGKLVRLPCKKCGATYKIEAHHWDYSKPLDVLWYCTEHHDDITAGRF